MRLNPHLHSVKTAVPPNLISQTEAAEIAHFGFAERYADFGRLKKVFETSGIRKRHTVKPADWYLEKLDWDRRNRAFLEGAQALFEDAARSALAAAELLAAEIDTIVTVSSSGIATPSIEARALANCGFRTNVERVPVFGLGCAGGVTGLSIASRLAAARPGTNVLLVCVELCSVSFRIDKLTKANIVATALFGDGAAACVISTRPSRLGVIKHTGEHTWPDTLSIMGWDIDPHGMGVIFDRSIPSFAAKHLGPAVDGILERSALAIKDIDHFVCHPGGAKVVDTLEEVWDLQQGALNDEREVLADFGNMSSPTVFFVLERALASGLPDTTLLTALGPGFTVSCATMTKGH